MGRTGIGTGAVGAWTSGALLGIGVSSWSSHEPLTFAVKREPDGVDGREDGGGAWGAAGGGGGTNGGRSAG